MTDRVTTELPMLGDFPPQVAAETREWPARVTIAYLRLIAKAEDLDALSPDIEATARRRRAQQVDQEQAMRSYEFAQQALVDEVTRRIRGHKDQAVLFTAFTRRLLEFQRVAAVHLTAGFTGPEEPDEHRRFDDEGQRLLERVVGRRKAGDDGEGEIRLRVTLPLRVTASTTVLADPYDVL